MVFTPLEVKSSFVAEPKEYMYLSMYVNSQLGLPAALKISQQINSNLIILLCFLQDMTTEVQALKDLGGEYERQYQDLDQGKGGGIANGKNNYQQQNPKAV